MKYSVITFGCRVNQADSLGFEEELRAAGAVAAPPESRGPRRRQHLLGDRHRGSGRTSDDPPRRARQPRRPHRRHRLLCDAAARRSRRVAQRRPRRAERRQAAVDRSFRLPRGSIRPRSRRGFRRTATAAAARPIEPGVAGRTAFTLRVQTGCARAVLAFASSRRPGALPRERADRATSSGRSSASTAAGFKEIALTGVHLGSCGCDLEPRIVADRSVDALRRLALAC